MSLTLFFCYNKINLLLISYYLKHVCVLVYFLLSLVKLLLQNVFCQKKVLFFFVILACFDAFLPSTLFYRLGVRLSDVEELTSLFLQHLLLPSLLLLRRWRLLVFR